MVRVLHILEQLSAVGGTPRKLAMLVRNSSGAVAHEFLTMLPGDMDQDMAAAAPVHCARSTNPARLTAMAGRIIGDSKIDVVSTHFTRSLLCGNVAARARNLPFVHHEHGPATENSGKGLAGRTAALLRRRWEPTAAAVICNSAYTAGTVRQIYRVPDDRLLVIHPPVEERVRTAVRTGLQTKREIVMGHIGGMIPIRDQVTMIRALALLVAAGHDARLVLIGDGPVRPKLEAEAQQLRMLSRVRFVGYVTELQPFFDEIDVFINTAVGEGFGIAVVEAMLAGVPVILADAGSHPELVRDGETGLLFQPGDAAALSASVQRVASGAVDARKLAAAAREFAARKFAPANYVNGVETVLREVAAKGRS